MERLRKFTWTAEVGYAEHGSKNSIKDTYIKPTRRLRRVMPTLLFIYAGANIFKKNVI